MTKFLIQSLKDFCKHIENDANNELILSGLRKIDDPPIHKLKIGTSVETTIETFERGQVLHLLKNNLISNLLYKVYYSQKSIHHKPTEFFGTKFFLDENLLENGIISFYGWTHIN